MMGKDISANKLCCSTPKDDGMLQVKIFHIDI